MSRASASAFTIAFALAFAFALGACVPASEKAPPAGAFGFVTEPSPAARGEPFVTTDGWTLRVEKIALQVSVTGHSLESSKRKEYGSNETYRFDASKSVELFARAIPTGSATGSISLNGNYLGSGFESASKQDADTEIIGLDPVTSARFRERADASADLGGYLSYSGPSLLFAVRAERAGRIITLDLTFDAYSGLDQENLVRDVREDELVTVPLTLAAEAIFTDEHTRALTFANFAAADTNRDGVITGAELTAATCASCADSRGPRPGRFVDLVRSRASHIFVAR